MVFHWKHSPPPHTHTPYFSMMLKSASCSEEHLIGIPIKKHWHQRMRSKIFYYHEIINFLWLITFEWLFSMGLWTPNFVITIIPTELSNIGCFFFMWRWYARIETTVTKPSSVELPGSGKLLWDVFPVPTAIIVHVIHNAIALSTELLFKYNSRYKLSRRCYLTQWIKQVKKKFSEGNKPT